jgi:TonB family protein
VALGLWQVRSLRRSALPWRHGQSVVESLAHRRVEVLLHEALPGPMTCGVVHPAIVLPQDARSWDEEDLERALIHELEHVRRADWLSHSLARAACAVYWFHPLVWIAWRRLALEAERACDDAVLGHSEATAYADQLVGLAQRLSVAAKSPLLAMANRADLATRVGAVLDSRQRRGRAGTLSMVLACAAAAVMLLTISPLTVVAAPQAGAINVAVETDLVIVDVVVSDKDGKSVEGLSADDFVLTEDGIPQTISVFEFQKGPVSSYYIVGYYTSNQNRDGQFRNIKITSMDSGFFRLGKRDDMAKVDFRAGYYARPLQPVVNRQSSVDQNISPGTTYPAVIRKVDPEYSEEARKAKYSGTVVLSVDVNTDGRAEHIQVVKGVGLGLDDKAIEAVEQWKFKPGTKDGKPVTMPIQLSVSFRLL